MDTNQAQIPELRRAQQMLVRRLLSQHGKGQPNWLNWQLHNEYLDLPKEERDQTTYQDYIIRELSK